MKRTLSRIGLGAALFVTALSAACGPQSLSSSTEPHPATSVSAPASSEPVTSASPSPAVVLPSPTALPASSPSPSTTLRYSSTPKVTVSPTSAACGGDYYRNVDGICVHRPAAAPTAPSGASAVCADGTYSFSQHRQGTCSHHGGVASWL